MSISYQKTGTCKCGKTFQLIQQGELKHGCGRTIVFNLGKVIEIKDRAKNKKK